MKSLPTAIVQSVVIHLQQGKSVRETSRTLNISVGAVSKVRQENQENIPDPKMGRPSKVSKATKRYIARQFDTGKIQSLREGQQLIQSMEGTQVHIESVRRYIYKEGLKGYVSQRKPDLTRNQKSARYQFAKRYLKWSVEDWKNVMFSDETIISRIGSFGKKTNYQRPHRTRLGPHQIQKAKQGGGGKLMLWGSMTYYGVGDASWIPGKMNSDVYVDVLQTYVLASRNWYGMDRTKFIFQQDNAAIHTTAKVKMFFAKSKIRVLEWPANSPDLNLIEHIWAHIKRRLYQYKEPPRTLPELWKRVQDIWTTIPIEFIHELYESMPRRIEMLYRNKGGLTKY